MKKWHKIAALLMFTGIIGAFAGYKFVYNKPHPDYANLKADHSLEAADLFRSFRENRTEAEQKYNGEMVEVSGLIWNVERADSLAIAVFVFEEGMFGDEGIRCTMLPEFNENASLLEGRTVTIKGLCTGYNETDVILEKCSYSL